MMPYINWDKAEDKRVQAFYDQNLINPAEQRLKGRKPEIKKRQKEDRLGKLN
jgi:hypothetical protein